VAFEGSDISFYCKSLSVPTWTKVGEFPQQFLVHLHTLTLINVTEKDSAIYQCEGDYDLWKKYKFKEQAKLLVAGCYK